MPWWLTVALLVLFVASRPIEARLWRAGRLSDRATTLLLLGRMPAMVLFVSLVQGGSLWLTLLLLLGTLLPAALFYRFVMNLLAEQRVEQQKEAVRSAKA
jgi:hypothetical protein